MSDITSIFDIRDLSIVLAIISYYLYLCVVMTTDKPRILLTLDPDLLERIDDYRYDNRIPARSVAIRRLIAESLKKYEKKKKSKK